MSAQSYLLALNGSKESLAAANVAWQLAKARNAKLLALSVVDNQAIWDLLGTGSAGFIGSGPYLMAYEVMKKALKEISETLMSAFAARSQNVQLETECLVEEGDVLRQVLEHAKSQNLVIMGRRSVQASTLRQDLHSYVRTSLSKRLSEVCPCPLLLVAAENHWVKTRLICNPETFSAEALLQFLTLTDPFNIEQEIFCIGSDIALDELMQKVKNIVPHSVNVICSAGNEGDEAIAVAMDVTQDILLVVATVFSEFHRKTSSGIQIDEFLSMITNLAVLVLPPRAIHKHKTRHETEKHLARKV
jgi:nucleotide-binding universal stress UspA family protein